MTARPTKPATRATARTTGRRGASGRKVAAAPTAPRKPATRPSAPTPRPVPPPPPKRRATVVAAAPPAAPVARAERLGAVRAHPWPQLTARDVMRRDVVTIDRATPLSEVERILADHKISGAPVTDETGAIVGVVSFRDLVERYAEDVDAKPRRTRGYFHLSSEELDEDDYELTELPEETEETAEDVMTAEVFSVAAEAPLADVARTMAEKRIHRVLVVSGGHFAGIVGIFEILQAFARAGDRASSQGSPS